MKTQLIKPLALGIGLALAAAGCSQSGNDDSAATSASSAPASSATVADNGGNKPVFDTDELSSDIDACQNFNGFVNAKWVDNHPIPSDKTSWGAFNKLREDSRKKQHKIVKHAANNLDAAEDGSVQKKIGRLFAAGMDTATVNDLGYDPIKSKLKKIDSLDNSDDIAHFINTSYNQGDGYVFGFHAGADQEDATKQIGYVSQSGLGLPTPAYYTSDDHADVRDSYVDYIAKSLQLVGVDKSKAKDQAQDVLDFETKLAKASLSPTQLRDLDNQYNFVSVKKADKKTPHFSWEDFFDAQGVDVGDGFSLSQPKFMAEFDDLLANAPMSQWQAYLKFHLVDSASPYLAKDFQKNHFDFHNKTLHGQPEQKDRWKRVLDGVNGAMGMGLGKLYVDEYFSDHAKERADQLVHNVRAALKQHIQNLDWMSDKTKKKAITKWKQFLPKIGYPDKGEWRDWSNLDIKSGHYFANLEAAGKYNYHYNIDKIGTKTDRKEWHMTPQTVNAYYNPSTNTINFPAAILQPPFFYPNGDAAINYGGIGAVIGHESSHGFDDQGSQYDGKGNRDNWWTDKDKKQFDKRTERLANQYDAYTPIDGKPDLHVNGDLTLGEDIADLGGLSIAHTALKKALSNKSKDLSTKIDGYTENQRFFMSWARVWRNNTRDKAAEVRLNTDPHAPPKVRAFATPSNMDSFAKAFQCDADDKMVRKNPVQIW